MIHPITRSLRPIDPPLEPGEKLEVYFAAAHVTDFAQPRRHAFGIVIHRSSGHPPTEISPPASWLPNTNSQRGNLGAVITIFEWLEKSTAQAHDVTIYSAESYIQDLEASSRSKGSKLKDLYDIILPKLKDWPQVRFEPQPHVRPHTERRDRALQLAKETMQEVFPPVEQQEEAKPSRTQERPRAP
jgi:hypothetical protein